MKKSIKNWSKKEIESLESKYAAAIKKENKDTLLKAMKNKIDDEAYDVISKFKNEFYLKFGVVPAVMYNFNRTNYFQITMQELEEICNMFVEDGDNYKIMDRTRKRSIVQIRHIFFYIGVKMGYTLTSLGKHLNYDHATVIHASRLVSNLIDINDLTTVRNLKLIHDEIEKRIEHNSLVYSGVEG
jgi:chromosomal replication initiation ATPase DnaA